VCTLPHSLAFGGWVVGRSFRNANRSIDVVGRIVSLSVRGPGRHPLQ
jgi:hypothetical protein